MGQFVTASSFTRCTLRCFFQTLAESVFFQQDVSTTVGCSFSCVSFLDVSCCYIQVLIKIMMEKCLYRQKMASPDSYQQCFIVLCKVSYASLHDSCFITFLFSQRERVLVPDNYGVCTLQMTSCTLIAYT